MIVANERGFSERSIHVAVAGERFFLIIVFSHEIDRLPPGKWDEHYERLRTRLSPGGRLIVADSSTGIGAMPKGTRQHSWVTPEEITQ